MTGREDSSSSQTQKASQSTEVNVYGASNSQYDLETLLKDNTQLRQDLGELEALRRINVALQARHTIEKLVLLIPDTIKEKIVGEVPGNDNKGKAKQSTTSDVQKATKYLKGSGSKWEYFWLEIWKDAKTNEESPFYEARREAAKTIHGLEDFDRHGRNLFKQLSEDIHNYGVKEDKPNYKHLNEYDRKILEALWPTMRLRDGETDWAAERDKYPKPWLGDAQEHS